MKHLSLFSGIGGFDLAAERAGVENVGQVESNAFCQRVLAARWPRTPRWADVREWQGNGHEPLDLLTGGFPCQDLSIAGKRAGLVGERSGLFSEIIRIATAIAPTWGLFENVPGLSSSRGGRDFALVLAGLRQCWSVVGYRILDSQHFGVPQRRRRVFFVCGPTDASVAQILFEPEGGTRDSQASQEAGQELATDIAASLRGVGGSPRGFNLDAEQGLVVAASLRSRSHRPGVNVPGRGGEDDVNLVVARAISSAKSGMRFEPNGEDYVVATLNSGGNDGGFRTEPGEHLVHGVRTPVRRLAPLECERLQGFPDGWTCLCQPLEAYQHAPDDAAMRCRCADSPRYRALGNAVTVNTVEWIMRRLARERGAR